MRRTKNARFFYAFFLSFILLSRLAFAMGDSLTVSQSDIPFKPKRLALVLGTETTIYGGLMVGLNSLWYKDFPKSDFHFFNDNNEWLQMDKVGHATTAYYVGKFGINCHKIKR